MYAWARACSLLRVGSGTEWIFGALSIDDGQDWAYVAEGATDTDIVVVGEAVVAGTAVRAVFERLRSWWLEVRRKSESRREIGGGW